MMYIVTKNGRVMHRREDPFPPELARQMKAAGYKITAKEPKKEGQK